MGWERSAGVIAAALWAAGSAGPLGAEEPFGASPGAPGRSAERERIIRETQEQDARRAQETLDRMRSIDPKLYRRLKAQHERQEAIHKILTAYHGGKLTVAEAKQKLSPLAAEEGKDRQIDIELQIDAVRQSLKELELLKSGPAEWAKRYIDRMLGVGEELPAPQAEPEDNQ
jgi:hypothetical protein